MYPNGFTELRCVRNADGQIEDWEWMYANPAALQLLGQDGAQLVGQRVLQTAPGGQAGRVLSEHCTLALAAEKVHAFELELSGTSAKRWLSVMAIKLGKDLALTFEDITQRKENEAALRKFLASLQAIFANTLHSFIFLGADGRVQAFNEIAQRQTQEVFGKEMLVGSSIYDVVPPTARADFDAHFAEALAGQTIRIERNFADTGQRAVWFECHYAPVYSEGPAASGVLFSAQPINERKEREHRREAQREAALSLSQASSRAELVRRSVAAARAMAGVTGGGLFIRRETQTEFVLEVLDLPAGDWLDPVRQVSADSPLGTMLEGQKPVFAPLSELPGLVTDSAAGGVVGLMPMPVQPRVSACLFLAAAGEAGFSAEQQSDLESLAASAGSVLLRIHARKQAQAALKREQQITQMKSRFISVASHEFRNPLTIISTSEEMLRKNSDRLTAAQRAESLEMIRNAARRIKTMLDEVLLVGRAEKDQQVLEPKECDLVEIVRSFIEEVRLTDRGSHVLLLDCQEQTIVGDLDEKVLQHILINLLNNAVAYSPTGSRVNVSLARDEEFAQVSVRDHGRGIPHEDLERMWEPFERGSNVSDIPGSGLGLNIAKLMAGKHKATLTCESELGVGTTFMLKVPLKASSSAES